MMNLYKLNCIVCCNLRNTHFLAFLLSLPQLCGYECLCVCVQHPLPLLTTTPFTSSSSLLLLLPSRELNLSSNKSLHCLRVYIIFIHCTCARHPLASLSLSVRPLAPSQSVDTVFH